MVPDCFDHACRSIIVVEYKRPAVVALDNWFNRETNPRTGIPFHYLWADKEFSGYSQWGEIFKTGSGNNNN
jgi:hypothetical protein